MPAPKKTEHQRPTALTRSARKVPGSPADETYRDSGLGELRTMISASPGMQTLEKLRQSLNPGLQQPDDVSTAREIQTSPNALTHHGITAESLPDDKKKAAEAWLMPQIKSWHKATPADLAQLLETARTTFFLSDIFLDFTDREHPRIGLAASPVTWKNLLIGNIASDWGVWGFYGLCSLIDDYRGTRSKKPGQQTHIQYGPLTGRGFGTYMLADPLTQFGPPGTSPSAENNSTWTTLKSRKQNHKGKSTVSAPLNAFFPA